MLNMAEGLASRRAQQAAHASTTPACHTPPSPLPACHTPPSLYPHVTRHLPFTRTPHTHVHVPCTHTHASARTTPAHRAARLSHKASASPINRLKPLFFPTRCARGRHFSGTDPVFVSQGRWPMIPSGVCDLVYCGAGCLGLSRGGLDLGLFRKSNRPSGRGGLDLGPFRKSNRPSRRGGLDIGLSKRANPSTRGGVVQSDARMRLLKVQVSLLVSAPSVVKSLLNRNALALCLHAHVHVYYPSAYNPHCN